MYRRDAPWGWATGGRCSWDPLTTLIAVRGASAEREGLIESGASIGGINYINAVDGHNRWVISAQQSNQSYLVLRNREIAQKAVDELLCQPRVLRRTERKRQTSTDGSLHSTTSTVLSEPAAQEARA